MLLKSTWSVSQRRIGKLICELLRWLVILSLIICRAASPAEILPLQVPTLLFAGALDVDVPMDMVEDYYWKAKRIAGERFNTWKIKHEKILPVDLAGSNQSLLSLASSDRAKSFATPIPLKFIKLNCDHYDVCLHHYIASTMTLMCVDGECWVCCLGTNIRWAVGSSDAYRDRIKWSINTSK